MKTSDYPLVSVIVPVFNDGERLRLCLEALAEQTYPSDRCEIVVVDNGSDASQGIEAIVASCQQARLAREATPGSYAARNKGLTLAKGEAIAFTDADCIPARDWLERGVARLRSVPDCGMIVGRIEVFFQDPARPTSIELYQSLTAFPQEQHLKEYRGGATANVMTWRHVIERVGPFDSNLKSSGDFEWGNRVYAAGYRQLYADEVVVKHPARSTWEQMRQRTVRAAGGVYDRFVGAKSSFMGKNKMLARLLLDDLTPPLNFTIGVFREPSIRGLGKKLQVSAILLLIRYASAFEKIRLRLGGISSRA